MGTMMLLGYTLVGHEFGIGGQRKESGTYIVSTLLYYTQYTVGIGDNVITDCGYPRGMFRIGCVEMCLR